MSETCTCGRPPSDQCELCCAFRDGKSPIWWNASPGQLLLMVAKYEAALVQIAIVCTDNMDRDKDHRMALDFVRQIANGATESK